MNPGQRNVDSKLQKAFAHKTESGFGVAMGHPHHEYVVEVFEISDGCQLSNVLSLDYIKVASTKIFESARNERLEFRQ